MKRFLIIISMSALLSGCAAFQSATIGDDLYTSHNRTEIATRQNEEGKTQIEERIFNIRGKQVMIDKDLALLYGVETKRLNEQVKRNIERFPEDFMFQLTQEECLRSQIAILKIIHQLRYQRKPHRSAF